MTNINSLSTPTTHNPLIQDLTLHYYTCNLILATWLKIGSSKRAKWTRIPTACKVKSKNYQEIDNNNYVNLRMQGWWAVTWCPPLETVGILTFLGSGNPHTYFTWSTPNSSKTNNVNHNQPPETFQKDSVTNLLLHSNKQCILLMIFQYTKVSTSKLHYVGCTGLAIIYPFAWYGSQKEPGDKQECMSRPKGSWDKLG